MVRSFWNFRRRNSKKTFEFVGPGVVRDRRLANQLHYPTCVLDKVPYEIGDYVYVENPDVDDDSLPISKTAFVAQITDLYDRGPDFPKHAHKASVQWFWRIDELPFAFQDRISDRLVNPQEVLINTSVGMGNEINVETLAGKCKVIYESNRKRAKNYQTPVYFFMRSYNGADELEDVDASVERKRKEKISQWYSLAGGDKSAFSKKSARVPESDSLSSDSDDDEKPQPPPKKKKAASNKRQSQKHQPPKHTGSTSKHQPPKHTGSTSKSKTSKTSQKEKQSSQSKRNAPSSVSKTPAAGTPVSKTPSKAKSTSGCGNDGDGALSCSVQLTRTPTTTPTVSTSSKGATGNRLRAEHSQSGVKKSARKLFHVSGEETPETGRRSQSTRTTPSRRSKLATKTYDERHSSSSSSSSDSDVSSDIPLSQIRKNKMSSKVQLRDSVESTSDEASVSSASSDSDSSSDDDSAPLSRLAAKKGKAGTTPKSTPKTPKSKLLALRAQRKGTPSTPKTPRLRLSAMTPTMASRGTPRSAPKGPLELARSRLHLSSVPDSLPCREDHFATILTFVELKLREKEGGFMYVTGVPGTGKTATVHNVINYLENYSSDLPFKFIEVNGMRLTEPSQIYVEIWQALSGEKVPHKQAVGLLVKRFTVPATGRGRECVVLLVDEVDMLRTREQKILYNLFDWPTHKGSRLVVLTIANTMDLPERTKQSVASRDEIRLAFEPYTASQLQTIISTRLEGLDAFDMDDVDVIAKKVSASTGDARRVLDICRQAIEVAERGGANKVTFEHVHSVLRELATSPAVIFIKSCTDHQKKFLESFVAVLDSTGLEEAPFREIYHMFTDLCRLSSLENMTVSETMTTCQSLASIALIQMSEWPCRVTSRVLLKVSRDDIQFAVRDSSEN